MSKDEQQYHYITREIGVDAGHRVTYHGSKCRNLHGHRYTIQVMVRGPLFSEGEQQGMVLDFGFLKDLMMQHIDVPCDHGMILWNKDPFVDKLLPIEGAFIERDIKNHGYSEQLLTFGKNTGGKYYIVPFVPTAENLARHWFTRLKEPIFERTNGQGKIYQVKVFETPNCSAVYRDPQDG